MADGCLSLLMLGNVCLRFPPGIAGGMSFSFALLSSFDMAGPEVNTQREVGRTLQLKLISIGFARLKEDIEN
jgi:hypothetical protein